MGFSGVDGSEGHAGVSEHLWGALFPQQSGHETLGRYIEQCEQALTWVTVVICSYSHISLNPCQVKKMLEKETLPPCTSERSPKMIQEGYKER